MATEEAVIEVLPVPGVRVRCEAEVEGSARTVWRVETGEDPFWSPAATVVAHHPRIDTSTYARDPIVDEQITLSITGESTYSRQRPSIKASVAFGVAVAMQEAGSRVLDIRKEIEPQVADRLKEKKEREEKARKEREERDAKRKAYNEKYQETQAKIKELTDAWIAEITEVLKWYEGQGGRLKRRSKKGWDTFHELGTVNRYGDIFWMWNGQRFSDRLIEVQKVEIRYESERSFDKLDIPKFPEAEINKIREELNSLERVW